MALDAFVTSGTVAGLCSPPAGSGTGSAGTTAQNGAAGAAGLCIVRW